MQQENNKNLKLVYFGGEPIGVPVLTELEAAGFLPSLVVCNPDRPVGRKQVLTSPPVKVWAAERNIEIFQPENLKPETVGHRMSNSEEWDLFVVVAYNKIMPKWLIELPKHKTINMHPSLLPKLRGASPIRSTILEDMRDECGVSVILLDEKMDHGPIIGQQTMDIAPEHWPIKGGELDLALARLGGALLASLIPSWIAGKIEPIEQDHDKATFCKKIQKADGELHIDPHNLPTGDDAYQALLKIRAYDGWPGTFFMYEGKRIKITDAELKDNGSLDILKVIPEGKSETKFSIHFPS